ncbi:MAG: DNA alkylation repair protein [Anaerolineales bacterium]|nr:DNA alkylation repair protein [Anaerolineales bacterium]
MPAIHLPRLQQQVEALSEHYADPEKFSRQLRDLFTFYGDKTRRPSEQARKAPRLPIENVPAPVLRQVVTQLTPYAEKTPHAILNLCRGLWQHPILEYRLLAAMLLGKAAISHAEETLDLVQNWALENKEEQILQTIAGSSLSTIRQQDANQLLSRVQNWLSPDEKDFRSAEITSLQKLGLSALLPFVEDFGFANLPRIYALITPLLRQSPRLLRPYLLDLLIPLARRSPQEVAYLLRTELEAEPSEQLKWLGRRTLPALPEENQARLRPLVSRTREE